MIIVELFQMTEFDVEQLIHQHRSISVSKSCNLSSKLEKGALANSQFLKCTVFRQHNPSTNIKKLLTLTEMKSCKSYKMETICKNYLVIWLESHVKLRNATLSLLAEAVLTRETTTQEFCK